MSPAEQERLGPYELVELIAKGGMGEVWRARQPSLDRAVAIKVIRAELGDQPNLQAAFEREAQALSQLKCPQTLSIIDFGVTDDDGRPYLVTEFLEGVDLRRRLAEQGALPVDQAVSIAMEVLKSLSEAHAAGIIHRDLKPANVFLQDLPAGRLAVKVLDFGIAKRLAESDAGQGAPGQGAPGQGAEDTLFPGIALKGSPRYMAPEQINNAPIDARTDIYAVGGLIYHMLAGEPIFGGSRLDVLRAHLEETPRPLGERFPLLAIPTHLDRLVMRCLAKDPLERPSSAEALIAELGDFHLDRLEPPPMSLETEGTLPTSSLEPPSPPPGDAELPPLEPLFQTAAEVHEAVGQSARWAGDSGVLRGDDGGELQLAFERRRRAPAPQAPRRSSGVPWKAAITLVALAAASLGGWVLYQRVAQPTGDAAPSGAALREKHTRIGHTDIEVENGPARFVRVDTGEIVCPAAGTCRVPIHTDVRIERPGFEPLTVPSQEMMNQPDQVHRVRLIPR